MGVARAGYEVCMKYIKAIMKNGYKHEYPYLHFVFEDGLQIDLNKAEEILVMGCNENTFIMITNKIPLDIFCTHCRMTMSEDEFERRLLEWRNV
jgi:hypothetical protein